MVSASEFESAVPVTSDQSASANQASSHDTLRLQESDSDSEMFRVKRRSSLSIDKRSEVETMRFTENQVYGISEPVFVGICLCLLGFYIGNVFILALHIVSICILNSLLHDHTKLLGIECLSLVNFLQVYSINIYHYC